MLKNSGFTLAEVLITLGIIGVVAALTIPTTITKFQQKTFSTAFKKEYSTLNNAINEIVFETDYTECYHLYQNGGYTSIATDCAPLKKNLINKLNLTSKNNNMAYLTRIAAVRDNGVSPNFNVAYESWLHRMSSYILKDGSILMFCYNEIPSECSYANVAFIIDTNGDKSPNRWGYDVFWLTLVKNNDGLRLSDEYSTLSEKGGSLPRNILLNDWGNNVKNSKDWGRWQ